MVQTSGVWIHFTLFLVLNYTMISRFSDCSLYFVLIGSCCFSQVYGPSEQNDWESASYPGVENAIASARKENTTESWKFVQHEIHRVARAITQASVVLAGSLT